MVLAKAGRCGLTESLKRFAFDLANPFSRETELVADLLQRLRPLGSQPEPQLEH